MKQFRVFAGLLFLVFVLVVPQIASATGIEAAVGGWQQDPSGDISYKGESLSFEDDLKYDTETKIFGRVKIETPSVIPNIYLMASPMEFEGDGRKDIAFTFGDTTFAANIPFHSSLTLNHYDIALYYGLPFIKTATDKKFNIELGLNARIIDFETSVSQDTLGLSESKSLTILMPMIYVGAQLKPADFIGIEAEIRGIAYSSNHYYDLIGRLKIMPIDHLFIAGGYRHESVKIDQDDVEADIKFKGPFLETGVEF